MATYSFMDVSATIVGPGGTVDLGYGAATAEEGISIAYTEDKNLMTVGADGKVMHTLRCGNSGTVTVSLLKTSPTAKKLQKMFNIQKLGASVWGVNTITIQQTAAKDKIVCLFCAVVKVQTPRTPKTATCSSGHSMLVKSLLIAAHIRVTDND